MKSLFKKQSVKVSVFLSVFLLSVLFYVFCNRADYSLPLNDRSYSIYAQELQNMSFEEIDRHIGVVHNEGLDYILKKIVLGRVNDGTDLYRLISEDSIVKYSVDFAVKNSRFNKDANVLYHNTDKIKKALEFVKNNRNEAEIITNLPVRQEQKVYLRQLVNIHDVSNIDVPVLSLVEEVKSDKRLSSSDKAVVFVAASIFKNSRRYWSDNIDKWEIALGKDLDVKRLSLFKLASWDSDAGIGLTFADIGGGILGFVWGGPMGAIGTALGASALAVSLVAVR